MKRETQKTTKRIAISAVLAALGVIVLWVGSLVQVLDLSMAVIASILVIFAVIELRGPYPMLLYVTTSVLSLLLLPIKTAALVYALFAGYYPIVKAVLEEKLPKWLAWVLKTLIFVVAVGVALLIAIKGFVPNADLTWLWAHPWAFALPLPVFLVYDVALTRLISLYVGRLRARFRFLDL